MKVIHGDGMQIRTRQLGIFPMSDLTVQAARRWGEWLWTEFVATSGFSLDRGVDSMLCWLQERWEQAGRAWDVRANSRLFGTVSIYLMLLRWTHYSFPHITTSAKFAAALMASRTEGTTSDLIVHWPTFIVSVPEGLIPTRTKHDNGKEYIGSVRLMIVDSETDGGARIFVIGQNYLRMMNQTSGGLSDLLSRDEEDPALETINVEMIEQQQARVCVLAKRLVSGLLLTMQHTDNFRPKVENVVRNNSNYRDGEPKHRTYFVGREISVDCRPWVRAYGSGERRNAPSVQSLVRGHHKRQVIGVGRTGRMVVWIEPYWRGPEDAPILVHSYRVDQGDKQ